jgi:peptidylprolyl isomerase
MRSIVLLGGLFALSLLAACGGDSSPGAAEAGVTVNESSGVKSTPQAAVKRGEPVVKVPPEPPPKEMVINDLLVGTGAAAETGDELTVHELAVEYETDEVLESIYGNEGFRFELGSGEAIEGWEQGLVGMRAGGRRELIIPPKLAYKKGTLIYVVDLLTVKKAPPSRGK